VSERVALRLQLPEGVVTCLVTGARHGVQTRARRRHRLRCKPLESGECDVVISLSLLTCLNDSPRQVTQRRWTVLRNPD
jgi:hypothetical protein